MYIIIIKPYIIDHYRARCGGQDEGIFNHGAFLIRTLLHATHSKAAKIVNLVMIEAMMI